MLISALRGQNLHISAQEVFMTKTLRGMAHLIDAKTRVDESSGSNLTSDSSTKSFDERNRPSSVCSSCKQLSASGDISADITKLSSVSASSGFIEIGQPFALNKDEKRLRSWWAAIFHRPEHSFVRNDNFFSCGGNEMAVLNLSRVASVFNIGLSNADIHAHPTLSEMAKLVLGDPNSRSAFSTEDTIIPFGNDVKEIIPASHTQLAFLIEGQKWCQSYYVCVFIKIDDSAPIAKIQDIYQIVA